MAAPESLTPEEADGLRAALVIVLERFGGDDQLSEIRGTLRWNGNHLSLTHENGEVSVPRAGYTRIFRPQPGSDAAGYCDVYIALSANSLADLDPGGDRAR